MAYRVGNRAARGEAVADAHEMSPDDASPEKQEHDRALRQFVANFEEAEHVTRKAREKSERDRDYVDGKQWTEDEAAKLRRRNQPVVAFNLIRARVNYHLGMEKNQRRDPRAYPRGPSDAQAAEIATEALRYAIERADYHTQRSQVWDNIKVEGCGALEASLAEAPGGNQDIKWTHVPWDRFFYDPHSSRPDFTDARYLGQVQWMDAEELLATYPEGEAAHAATMSAAGTSGGTLGDTYEDKPRFHLWVDAKRRRVRVVQIWYLQAGAWLWAEFCLGGILAGGPSPWVDDDGATMCGLIAESCYVDRDNMRYGEVRDLIDPQDEVNKRRSKALHAVNTNLVITEHGAIQDGDTEKARREANKPDGFIVVAPGRRFEIDRNTEMSVGQTALMQQAVSHIMSVGPNAALLGKGTEDQSGRAIQSQQQGGMIELGGGLDVLRRLDRRVFRFTWFGLRQYWTAPMWIRVTEDEEAPRFIGINQPDPMTGQPMNVLGRADVDIEIGDAPDTVSLTGENFAAVLDVLKSGAPPPVMKFIAELHPGLKTATKRKLSALADQMTQAAAQEAQKRGALEEAKVQGDLAAKNSKAQVDQGHLQLDALETGVRLSKELSEPPQQPAGQPANAPQAAA